MRRGFSMLGRLARSSGGYLNHVTNGAKAAFRQTITQVPKTNGVRTVAFVSAATVAAVAVTPTFTIDGSDPAYVKVIRSKEKDIRAAIADAMDGGDFDGHGSYGPVFVRLAWHASGTYDKDTKTGGSNGASMRFEPESKHGANNGLNLARERLEVVKKRFPEISYADLWTLAGVVAIAEMGGPAVSWRPGRSDYDPKAFVCPPDGRLPDASQRQKHVRDIFGRMGFKYVSDHFHHVNEVYALSFINLLTCFRDC